MFPNNSQPNKTNCLASLVGIRSACQANAANPPFFIEDIEGFDIQKLSALAVVSLPRGEDLGQWVVASAAREMMGDIELLANNGFTMNSIMGSQCSSCNLLPVYTPNTGIIIKSIVTSSYQKLQITRLTILANVSGSKELILDDGITQAKYYPVLQAGVKIPVNLTYETSEKSVRVYFSDNTIPLGQVLCPTNSSCGCGASSASNSPYVISGMIAGNETVNQFGFLPCASVGCSYDALVCSMIGQTPNIFGLALLYKIGEKLLIIDSQSERNNEKASFKDQQDGELVKNYGQLYWAKMQGAKGKRGIKNIISDFLKRESKDKCVICDSKFYTASAVG